jgi:hypothetical protein
LLFTSIFSHAVSVGHSLGTRQSTAWPLLSLSMSI